MNWINLLWLGVGFGLGLVYRQWKQPAPKKLPHTFPLPDNNLTQPSTAKLKQLELAYQMASEMSQFKGGYLARTSHELRSPLNGLIGMHQLILADLCDSPEEEREFLAQANNSAHNLVAMLDGILDVARLQHGNAQMEIQPVQLTNLFQEIDDLTALPAKDRNIKLHFLLPDPEIYVHADLVRLRQVLLHLVDAALLTMPEEGVTVSADFSTTFGCVRIWINDQCPVSKRSEAINLLQSEASADSALPSPGLNLLADQMLLQMMNGQLEVVTVSSKKEALADDVVLTQIQCSLPGYRGVLSTGQNA